MGDGQGRTTRRSGGARTRTGGIIACAVLALAAVAVLGAAPASAVTVWTATGACGSLQSTTVPAGVYSMSVVVAGGNGGKGAGQSGGTTSDGAVGGEVVATIPVTPGATISAVVGCNGANGDGGNSNVDTPSTSGWSRGGGTGQGSNTAFNPNGAGGGAGGGASAVCLGATCSSSSATQLVVAGGGGGSGSSSCALSTGGPGGKGGWTGAGTTGGGGTGPSGDKGGDGSNSAVVTSSIPGGAGGVNSSGGSANGGSSPDGSGGLGVNVVGGGGGGGYRGGAAGSNAATGCKGGGAGGGGSSWVTSSRTGNPTFRSGVTPKVVVTFANPVANPPGIGTATPGDGAATVAWTAKFSVSPITGYRVTPYVGGVAQTPQSFSGTAVKQTLTGLTNGTTYTFAVQAVNALGTSGESAQSNPVTVGVPGQPVLQSAQPLDGAAKVGWFTPAANGAPITSYTITPYEGATALAPQVFAAGANYTVTGLTNGTEYTFRIAATNSIGTGAQSPPTTAVRVGSPSAPAAPTVAGGDASVKVTWKAPAANGSPITGYTVTPFIGTAAQTPQVFASTALTQTITGLTNGTAYTFRVAATNGIGTSTNSPASAAVTPGLPGTPVLQSATPGDGSAKVGWFAPAANGSAITSYTITPYIAGVAQTPQVFASATSNQTVTGLTNGTAYTFRIAATNAVGTGAVSNPTAAVTVGTPGAPVLQVATPGDGTAKVAWWAPAANGSPITGYTITPFIAGVAQTPQVFASTATTQTVTGLTNGTSYTFKITATNANGAGVASAATAAVVVGAPVAPAKPTGVAGVGEVTLSWVAPADNGSAISGYAVTTYVAGVAQGTATFASTATTQVITGLTGGVAYTFRVAAINGIGTGPTSPASNTLTPT